MLGWIALIILGIFLACCGIAVFASLVQIINVTVNNFNSPKRTGKVVKPAEA